MFLWEWFLSSADIMSSCLGDQHQVTPLAAITLRLEKIFADYVGADRLELIKDSKPVDRRKLQPNKAYIQVTSVKPYFTAAELAERRTDFERNHNVSRFYFETPYQTGETGHVSEMNKILTILTLADGKAFPYLKTR